jgi:hypothetical protein
MLEQGPLSLPEDAVSARDEIPSPYLLEFFTLECE